MKNVIYVSYNTAYLAVLFNELHKFINHFFNLDEEFYMKTSILG
jgi:hypothetical protein